MKELNLKMISTKCRQKIEFTKNGRFDFLQYNRFYGIFCYHESRSQYTCFLGLTENQERKSKKQIARTASIGVFLIVVAFILAGK